MTKLREKLQSRFDTLHTSMQSQKHLGHGQDFDDLISLVESITKFWSILSEAERDYMNAVRLVIQDQKPWQ